MPLVSILYSTQYHVGGWWHPAQLLRLGIRRQASIRFLLRPGALRSFLPGHTFRSLSCSRCLPGSWKLIDPSEDSHAMLHAPHTHCEDGPAAPWDHCTQQGWKRFFELGAVRAPSPRSTQWISDASRFNSSKVTPSISAFSNAWDTNVQYEGHDHPRGSQRRSVYFFRSHMDAGG